jgi:hypothetical protein
MIICLSSVAWQEYLRLPATLAARADRVARLIWTDPRRGCTIPAPGTIAKTFRLPRAPKVMLKVNGRAGEPPCNAIARAKVKAMLG